MSVQLTPSKRSYDRNSAESNGKGKWQKSSQHSQLKISHASNVIRVLCPVSRIGNVIGKGGNIISQIRQESGAKIRVEETVPGCDERVIVIACSDKENEVGFEQGKVDGGETDKTEKGVDTDKETEGGSEETKADGAETEKTEKGDGEEKLDNNDEDKQSVPVEDSQSEKDKSSVHKALLLVYERMVEGETETEGGNEDDNKSFSHVVRLIVPSSQVKCLLGKGGSIIKQMSSESGAQIWTLPRDKLPLCACPSDELVEISGKMDAVKKALQSVCQQLLENSGDQDTLLTNSGRPSSRNFSRRETIPQSSHSFHRQGPPFSARSGDGEMGLAGRMNPPEDFLTFVLLCPDEKVGGVIGKGGNVIKALQHETGCEIKVVEGVAGSEDRIIVISGPAHPDDRISAVQDAVLHVQSRIFRAAPESKEKNIAKIVVSSNQIGCLLGKGGSVIAEMRKSSGAYIRILGKEQIPKCLAENEEVVQINGELEAVQEALIQITERLRDRFFRDAFPSVNHRSNPAFLDQMPPFPSYMGRREFSPPGMYSNLGPQFHKFGGHHSNDDRAPFMHDFHRPGMPPLGSERMPSSAPWGPKGMVEEGGPMGLSDYPRAPQRRIGGFGGGNNQAIITSTTVEVVVPRSVVPAIYGEDGGCLRQIREISDAKITITDPKPGATETLIIISGTPEQTNAAQSLIQAFVVIETEGS